MKKKLFALTAIASLSLGVIAPASAASTYEVQKGDSLWQIARDHKTSVQTLKNDNSLTSHIIYPEQELRLADVKAKKTKVQSKKQVHVVKRGDTLYDIAKANNVKVYELQAWNDISSSLILPGQKLALSGEKVSAPAAKPAVKQKQQSTKAKPATKKVSNTKQTVKATPAKTESKKPTSATTTTTKPATSSKPTTTTTNNNSASQAAPSNVSRTLTVSATAYTPFCAGCSGITATGIDVRSNPNMKVIAVDPSVIPLGSRVWVEGYGEAIAGDTGGAIKGNKIDILVPTTEQALQWGRRTVTIKILN